MEEQQLGKTGEFSLINSVKLTTEAQQPLQKSHNWTTLILELDWVKRLIEHRTEDVSAPELDEPALAPIQLEDGPYSDLIQQHHFGLSERITLGLTLLSNLQPEVLDRFLEANPETGKPYREYGGFINRTTLQFQPTLRTAIFLLAGRDKVQFIRYQNELRKTNRLFAEQIVNLHAVGEFQQYLPDCLIQLDPAYIDYFLSGEVPRLDSGAHFPAALLETNKTLDDLILNESAKSQLEPALNYVKVQQQLYANENVSRKIKKGFVLLLCGPPGTGKTLTASILGNELNTPVYQVDSSLVVSKYIGETEKNLESVFNRLQGKNCILFFDEADSLFGKRTEVRDSKDRYANQGVSYLLQRLEKFDGLVILASNYEQNFDEAFKRRILTKIHIGRPAAAERLQLWNSSIPEGYTYESEELVNALSLSFDFTGANIAVVVKMSVEKAFSEKKTVLTASLMAPFLEIVGREVAGANYRPLIFKE